VASTLTFGISKIDKALVGGKVQSFPEFPENLENAAISDKVLITPVGIFHFILLLQTTTSSALTSHNNS
jgi:hypothetical protein